MSIHEIGPHSVGSKDPPGTRDSGSEELEDALPVRHSDSIDISPGGRNLAIKRSEEASEAQLQQVQKRVRNGFYDRPSVAAELARRLRSNGIVEVVIP